MKEKLKNLENSTGLRKYFKAGDKIPFMGGHYTFPKSGDYYVVWDEYISLEKPCEKDKAFKICPFCPEGNSCNESHCPYTKKQYLF